MTCTWTNRTFYSEYVNTQLRGDQNALGRMYRPAQGGVSVKGGAITVSIVDIENMGTHAIACGTFPAEDGNCNTSKALTMATREVSKCFLPCEWKDLQATPGGLMRFVAAQASTLAGYFMDLIYVDMIANGTASPTPMGAVPTGATTVAALLSCLAEIWARNLDGKITIILRAADFALFVQAVGAAFQPFSTLIDPFAPNGAFRGWYLGAAVFITPTALVTADTTPIVVGGVIFHEMGYSWVPGSDNTADDGGLGAILGFVPADANPFGTQTQESLGGCFGYGLLDDEMVYYLDYNA